MPSLARRLVAEAIGTFALVFFGCASVIVNALPGANLGLMGIALTHAIVLAVMVTATMGISGGVLNPALTIGLAAVRRLDLKTAAAYLVAQSLAGVVAGFALTMVFPEGVARVVRYGTPTLNINVGLLQGIGIEALLGFFLMSAVFGTIVSLGAPKVGGFGVGLSLIFLILVAGPLTGASVNPARALGPAIVSGSWTAHIVYWIGPTIGAVIAAFLWDRFLVPEAPARREEAGR